MIEDAKTMDVFEAPVEAGQLFAQKVKDLLSSGDQLKNVLKRVRGNK